MHLRTTLFVASFASALAFVGIASAGEHEEHAAAAKPGAKPAEPEKAKAPEKGEHEKGEHEKGDKADKDKDKDDEGDKAAKKAEHEGDENEDEDDRADKEGERPWTKLKKKEERLEALKAKLAERDKEFPQRLERERARLRAFWGPLASNPDVVAELKQHAERRARLRRIRDLAEVEGQDDIAKRAEAALKKEHERHEHEEAKLKGAGSTAPNAAPSAQANAAASSAVNAAPGAKGGAQ